MIILRQLPFIDTLSLIDMMSFDTKANIIEHCKLARIDIPKSWRKAQIADALVDIFTNDPLWTLEVLPEEELELLKKLLTLSTEECIKYPRNDAKYLIMQKLHLVVSYEAATEWHIFMPSCIRKILDNEPLDVIHVKSEIPVTLKEKGDNINQIDILEQYPKLSQVAFFVTLELVNLNLGNKFPYEDFFPYIDDLQRLEEAMMKGAKLSTLESYAELLMMDMRTLYRSFEKQVPMLKGKNSSTLTDAQHDYAMHSGTMLNAMQNILLRFHHIPSEDLAKMILANKKKNGLLHFDKLEKMAQEISEELLMELMNFTMGI